MPNRYLEKLECWSSLFVVKETLELVIFIVVGDLNTHIDQSKKRDGSCACDPMREEVEDLISEWDLQYINPIKVKLIWTNKRSNLSHIVACLDLFLIHSDLLLLPLDISFCIIPFSLFDHRPISLSLTPPQKFVPIPFRFNPSCFNLIQLSPLFRKPSPTLFWAPRILFGRVN